MPRGARARHLSLLLQPGNGALGRCGDRRLQLLLRRQRPAAYAGAGLPMAGGGA
ncbi:helicase C-terminal domain protein, partial [Bordetella hinzii L60]